MTERRRSRPLLGDKALSGLGRAAAEGTASANERAFREEAPTAPQVEPRRPDETERTLGRTVAIGVPIAAVIGTVAAGVVAGAGAALLVLAAAALLGAIGFLWASVRTLSGDAPLAAELEALSSAEPKFNPLAEEKGRLLRALKDLETEHELGKIDDADYEAMVSRYREEAKLVMRKLDVKVAPFREEAERIALEHLRKRGLAARDTPQNAEAETPQPSRAVCAGCATSNEADATFCKQCGAPMRKGAGHARA